MSLYSVCQLAHNHLVTTFLLLRYLLPVVNCRLATCTTCSIWYELHIKYYLLKQLLIYQNTYQSKKIIHFINAALHVWQSSWLSYIPPLFFQPPNSFLGFSVVSVYVFFLSEEGEQIRLDPTRAVATTLPCNLPKSASVSWPESDITMMLPGDSSDFQS